MEFGVNSFDDLLQGLHTDNLLVTLLFATFAPAFIRAILYFFTVVWPNLVYYLVVRLILQREVVGAPVNIEKAADVEMKRVNNELLVEILLTYVGHRLQLQREAWESSNTMNKLANRAEKYESGNTYANMSASSTNFGRSKNSNWNTERENAINNSNEQQGVAPALYAQLQFAPLPYKLRKRAKECIRDKSFSVADTMPATNDSNQSREIKSQGETNVSNVKSSTNSTTINTENSKELEQRKHFIAEQKKKKEVAKKCHNGKAENSSNKSNSVCATETYNYNYNYNTGNNSYKDNSDVVCANPMLSHILLNEYAISTVPTPGVAVEVEKGLFVRYIPAKIAWNKFINQSLSKANSNNDGQEDNNSNSQAKSNNSRSIAKGATVRETYLLYDLLGKLRFWPEDSRHNKCNNNNTTSNDSSGSSNTSANLGPFGSSGEDTWWSRLLNINFAWNGLFANLFGSSIGENGQSNANGDGDYDEEQTDDDEEKRALEEERREGYIARQIIIESVRLEPISFSDNVHKSELYKLWRATPFSYL